MKTYKRHLLTPFSWPDISTTSAASIATSVPVPTYYSWKSKYGGMEASDLRRTKALESENAKLKRMYADLALENAAMKELITKKL